MKQLREWYGHQRVFVTGHTGFKGSWLTSWLRSVGARVTGYSLPPPADRPSLFQAARVEEGIESVFADVRDANQVADSLRTAAPDLVFHLAAQSLVRRSYREPVETYATNVMGTVLLLEAARRVPSIRAIVVVTSDKCYENRNLERGYREDDPVGGYDPYSSSKGCAELVTAAFRRSFFAAENVAVASARAGNVIGGGDWAEDRLVPDLMGAAERGQAAVIRNPDAVRPWQFVLEPVRGYLMLGKALAESGQQYAEAWNFSPRDGDAVTVREVVGQLQERWDQVKPTFASEPVGVHEARLLKLDHAKARSRLGWAPVLSLTEAVDLTVAWYRGYSAEPGAARALVEDQLRWYAERVDTMGRAA
jgi:CDP-glucose 4,6-dehydratase